MAYNITEACAGCTACSRSCPVMAITGTLKERHVINAKRCVECGVCGRICPKGAVTDSAGNIPERLPRKDWPKPVFDAARCTACGICVQACTAGALDITRPQFQGDLNVAAWLADEKKCVGCGLCARECPMDAIHMEGGQAS